MDWSSCEIVFRIYPTWLGQELSNLDVVLPDSAHRHPAETYAKPCKKAHPIKDSENHNKSFF